MGRKADTLHLITSPQRLNQDEKLVFEFLGRVIPHLELYESKDVTCNYILEFIKYDTKDDHTEALSRKSFELLDKFFDNIDDDYFKFKYLPRILVQVKAICDVLVEPELVQKIIKMYVILKEVTNPRFLYGNMQCTFFSES